MSSRNREKIYCDDSYYHVYNRGVNKRKIFMDDEDYAVFLNLLKRYLDSVPIYDNKGREYDWLHEKLELLCYCLMPNHFHLFIFQYDSMAMTRLMRGVATSYTIYFNKKYKRVGPLFQDRFKASMIQNDAYLEHVSRYIHLNPKEYLAWEYSSLPYYLGKKQAGWLRPEKILEDFKSPQEYLDFVEDYAGAKESQDEVDEMLAG